MVLQIKGDKGSRIAQVISVNDKNTPLTKIIDIDGIQIAAPAEEAIKKLFQDGAVRQIVKGKDCRTIVVADENGETTNITIHSASVGEDPTKPKSCSIDIPALKIEGPISDNGQSLNLTTIIRRVMSDLYQEAFLKKIKAKPTITSA